MTLVFLVYRLKTSKAIGLNFTKLIEMKITKENKCSIYHTPEIQTPYLASASVQVMNLFMRGSNPESFVRGGPTLPRFFRSGRTKIPLLAGHRWPASETPFELRFSGGPIMAQQWMLAWYIVKFYGIPTGMPWNPIFCDFSGGGGSRPPAQSPSGSAHAFTSRNVGITSHMQILDLAMCIKGHISKNQKSLLA